MKRNEIGSFVETWMDLKTVIQSEVSQKEKNMPFAMFSLLLWLWEDAMMPFVVKFAM